MWTDEVKTAEEPSSDADLLKVEVVDEVKALETEDDKVDKGDASTGDENNLVKEDEKEAAELSVDIDKDSK